jgi:hypothetical protein
MEESFTIHGSAREDWAAGEMVNTHRGEKVKSSELVKNFTNGSCGLNYRVIVWSP